MLKSAAKCNVQKLNRKATFEELGFDSLDTVELVVAMEEHFGFDIHNEEAEKIRTVEDAVTVFNKHMVDRLNQDKLAQTEKTTAPEKKEWSWNCEWELCWGFEG